MTTLQTTLAGSAAAVAVAGSASIQDAFMEFLISERAGKLNPLPGDYAEEASAVAPQEEPSRTSAVLGTPLSYARRIVARTALTTALAEERIGNPFAKTALNNSGL